MSLTGFVIALLVLMAVIWGFAKLNSMGGNRTP